jgi:hypothetical protein
MPKEHITVQEKLVSDEVEKYLQALRLECVKLAVQTASPGVEMKEPWARSNKFYTYVLYGKPMEVA